MLWVFLDLFYTHKNRNQLSLINLIETRMVFETLLFIIFLILETNRLDSD